MKNDPLAVLVRRMTPEEKEQVKEYHEAEMAEREKHTRKTRKKRIPAYLAILWCEWNRKCEDSADRLAYEFGRVFKMEVLAEWNKPTTEELETAKSKKREARRLRYNAYMKKYLREHRKK